jgi:hypothetical protein
MKKLSFITSAKKERDIIKSAHKKKSEARSQKSEHRKQRPEDRIQ